MLLRVSRTAPGPGLIKYLFNAVEHSGNQTPPWIQEVPHMGIEIAVIAGVWGFVALVLSEVARHIPG